MNQPTRETLHIVVVGHVDHGKSTLIGRLLYDTDSLPSGAIEKVEKLSKEKGKQFEYAFLLDALEEEQQQGITIDMTQLQFATDKRDYVIIDAPGHKQFLKNMISGAASAEAAFLIIDAAEGVKEQSKRHGYILSLLGIQKVYVIINKMDLVEYSEASFEGVRAECDSFLKSLDVEPIAYIPISAFYGENIARDSEQMEWYQGGNILTVMDTIETSESLDEKPLRFPIQDVYKFDDRRIIVGRIESGKLQVGETIVIRPGQKTTKVKSIEDWGSTEAHLVAYAGQSIGITVEDEFFNQRGELITHEVQPCVSSRKFEANLFWLGNQPLVEGKDYKLKLGTQQVNAKIIKIHQVMDASTLEKIQGAYEINKNDVAVVTIQTAEPVCFDYFADLQKTGRFVLVDALNVSGGGIIHQVLADEIEEGDQEISYSVDLKPLLGQIVTTNYEVIQQIREWLQGGIVTITKSEEV